MLERQQQKGIEQNTIRYKIIQFLDTHVVKHIIPLHIIEIIAEIIIFIQILKFPIDYYSKEWFASLQPLFLHLDPSYYLSFKGQYTFEIIFFIAIAYMNFYWLVQLQMLIISKTRSHFYQNVKKIVFIVNKFIFLLPLTNIIFKGYSCNKVHNFLPCYQNFNQSLNTIGVISYFLYTAVMIFQQYFNFQFIGHSKQFRRLKKSSLSTTFLLVYAIGNQIISKIVNQFTFLMVMNISIIFLMIIFYIKDEQLNQKVKLIQLSGLLVNSIAIVMLNILYFQNIELTLFLFIMISGFAVLATFKANYQSLEYQLQNINKWNNSEIMIRYAQNLRYFVRRINQYSFKVNLEGYIQIHNQKCTQETCPLKAGKLKQNSHQNSCFQNMSITHDQNSQMTYPENKQSKTLLQNLIRKIYLDGYQQNPVNHILQLEYSIFLYEKGEKQLSLKKLLMIPFEEIPLSMYYKFYLLKRKIHTEMIEEPDKIFLDLVSELYVKENERIILNKFEQAALTNLQFWGLLKQDHPNFKKLNQTGAKRIKIRQQVKENYDIMSKIVNNQRITNLYVNYLQIVQNDEQQYNVISQRIKEQYNLEEKIVLEDWINATNAILLVSIEESSYATIIDLNMTCSSLFGYERYELLNRSVKYLMPNNELQGLKEFISSTNKEQTYMLSHKNGYLLKIKKNSKIYNSFETGITAIINISAQSLINTCCFGIRNDLSILGSSSSIVSLIGIERKVFQKKLQFQDFFLIDHKSISNESNHLYSLKQIVRPKYEIKLEEQCFVYKVKLTKGSNCDILQIINVDIDINRKMSQSNSLKPISFQFQVEANLLNLKYIGASQSLDNYVSQFSQLVYSDSYSYQKQKSNSYASGIKTLRLNYNIIQVIQQVEEQSLRNLQTKDSHNQENQVDIQRKYQQQIFKSKVSFESFIKQYKYARSVLAQFFLWLAALLSLFIVQTILVHSYQREILKSSQEITYQNLIIGTITKQISLLKSLEEIKMNISGYSRDMLLQIYRQNLQYLEEVKLKGVQSYQIYFDQNNNKSEKALTSQFILTFIKDSSIIYGFLQKARSIEEIMIIYNQIGPASIKKMINKGQKVINYMIGKSTLSVQDFQRRMTQIKIIEILMFVGGIVFLILFTIQILYSIHRINQQRIKIFSIFLDVSQIKIQQFSSNTEKFLSSIHNQSNNNQIDVEEQVENIRKIHSSTFAKKKKLSQINFNKLVYLKFLIIPLIGSAFFLESFLKNYEFINFQLDSHKYFYLTSYGDYKFYSGLSTIQDSYLNNYTNNLNQLSADYFNYYHEYFQLHFTTFGTLHRYHTAFAYTFLNDICQGSQFDVYGSVKIQKSCSLPQLSQNGSYLIFTDLVLKTTYLEPSSYDMKYLEDYEILSITHRLISKFMIKAQQLYVQQVANTTYKVFVVWTLVMGFASVILGLPIIYLFINQINHIKNIITIMPISLVKELPLASVYINKIIKERQKCC